MTSLRASQELSPLFKQRKEDNEAVVAENGRLHEEVERLSRFYINHTAPQAVFDAPLHPDDRAVVEEIADREFELQRADLVDGESERGETH